MKEEVWVDLSKFLPPLRKFRFRQLQQIAFQKKIGWIDTRFEYQTNMNRQQITICFNSAYTARCKDNKYLLYGRIGDEIEYPALIRKLRAL